MHSDARPFGPAGQQKESRNFPRCVVFCGLLRVYGFNGPVQGADGGRNLFAVSKE